MDKRPLPYSFIINHKSAGEITKRLKFLGFSADKISEAKKIRRKHKLSLYGCSYKKRWGAHGHSRVEETEDATR